MNMSRDALDDPTKTVPKSLYDAALADCDNARADCRALAEHVSAMTSRADAALRESADALVEVDRLRGELATAESVLVEMADMAYGRLPDRWTAKIGPMRERLRAAKAEEAIELTRLRARVVELEAALRELRPEVRAFAVLMEQVLRKHDNRGGWKDCDAWWLLDRANEEWRELKYALGGKGPHLVALEAVDVANFAMMIADVETTDGLQSLCTISAARALLAADKERGK